MPSSGIMCARGAFSMEEVIDLPPALLCMVPSLFICWELFRTFFALYSSFSFSQPDHHHYLLSLVSSLGQSLSVCPPVCAIVLPLRDLTRVSYFNFNYNLIDLRVC